MPGGFERKLRWIGLLASAGMLLAAQSHPSDAGALAAAEPEQGSPEIEEQIQEAEPEPGIAEQVSPERLLSEANEEAVAEAQLAEPARERKTRYEVLVPQGPSEPAEKTQVLTQGNLTVLSNAQPPRPTYDPPRAGIQEPPPVPKSASPEATEPVARLAASSHHLKPTSARTETSSHGSRWFLALGAIAFLLLAPIVYLLTRATRRAG